MLKREEVERIKEKYPKGTPIRLYSMEGEHTVPPGSRGVVDHVDDIGQIHMKWENGSSLAVFFFAKLGTAYFDYRKHGQFEWAAPAILFACLVFTLTAPAYIWTILGM